jgi:hypothetical protein
MRSRARRIVECDASRRSIGFLTKAGFYQMCPGAVECRTIWPRSPRALYA